MALAYTQYDDRTGLYDKRDVPESEVKFITSREELSTVWCPTCIQYKIIGGVAFGYGYTKEQGYGFTPLIPREPILAGKEPAKDIIYQVMIGLIVAIIIYLILRR